MHKLFRSAIVYLGTLMCFFGCSAHAAVRNNFSNRGGFGSYPNPYAHQGFGNGMSGTIAPEYAFGFFIVGALLGAFFSQRFKQYRKWIMAALFSIAAMVFLTQGGPFAYAGWFILGFIVAWMLLRIVVALTKVKSTLFGSAEWADRVHILARSLAGNAGLWLGTFRDKDGTLDLHYTGTRHLLTISPTGSGKGVGAIIPNLLTYTGSVIVIDPKGENAMITADQRRRLGQDVYVVDPWGITGEPTACFNPLDWLSADDPDVGENALMLADAIVVREGGGDSKFWDDEAAALLWGTILYAAIHPAAMDRTLGGVRDIITAGPDELDGVLKAMLTSGNLVMQSTATRLLSMDEKMRANIFTTLQSHTHFLDSPRMRESLSASDFRFEDLKAAKGTVYLVLPADRLAPFSRWLRLLIQQAITVNARNVAVKPDKPILFLLDEMAALGKLQKVEEAFGLMAGFGMQLWGIAQDASQLKRIYGDGWETFVANAGVLQYFGSRDERTSSYFSKLCGVGTHEKVSLSTSTTRGAQGASFGTSKSTDHVQRQLAFPDELMRVQDGKEVLLIENNNPVFAEKLVWYTDQRLSTLGVNLGGRSNPSGQQLN